MSKRVEMVAECWLHIGTEKTGTTSIQEFLATNRGELLKRGYLYPESPGSTNHVGLACYAEDDNRFGGLRRAYAISTIQDVLQYRSTLVAKLDAEVERNNPERIIFSSEHLSSRLAEESEILRIKALCERYATKTRVIIYLRNQVDFLVSRYIESVKGGNTRPFPDRVGPAAMRLMDYQKVLAPWRETFGFGNLVVRRFAEDDFQGGDLLTDFEMEIGLPLNSLNKTARRNEALSAECIEFLRHFNKYIPHTIDGRRNPLRGDIVTLLEHVTGGSPFHVSRRFAEEVEAIFRNSNERVARDYFASRYQPLFPTTETRTPSPSTTNELDIREIARIAAYLWTAQRNGTGNHTNVQERHVK